MRAVPPRRGLWGALGIYALVLATALVVEVETGQRETAAETAAILLYLAFFGLVLFHRRAALMLLMVVMPIEPMLRTWGGTRFLTFAYGALMLMIIDLGAVRRRLIPLDAGFWLLAIVILWTFASLGWTPTRWAGLLYSFGMLGVLVAYTMPRGLFANRLALDDALRALVAGAVVALFLHAALLPEARQGRLGAHYAMSPQDVGANFGVAFMAALYLARNYPRGRRLLIAAAGVLGLGVVLTASRGAVASAGAGGLAFLVLSSEGTARWVRAFALVAGIGACYVVAYAFNPLAFQPRIARTVDPTSPDEFLTGRVSLWTVALAMVREHPLTGVGAGSYPEEFDRYYRITPARHGFGRNPDAHSLPLRTAAEVGVPAALLYLGFLAYALASAWRVRQHPDGVGALAVGLTLCCIALTSVAALYQPVLWMGTGLGLWMRRQPWESTAPS